MPEIYPIGGGKGGVGKSFIVASLGALFARQGNKVVLVDLDLGGSNLHTFLGIKNPKNGIDSFLNKKVKALEQVAVPTYVPNLFIISSLHCSIEIANLFHTQKQKIIKAIKKLPFDYILLDLGAGTNFNTLDFFLTSKNGILILMEQCNELIIKRFGTYVGTATCSSAFTFLFKKLSIPLFGFLIPKKVWRFEPPKSKSTKTTLLPCLANNAPRLAAIKLFPTPPLPPPIGYISGIENFTPEY